MSKTAKTKPKRGYSLGGGYPQFAWVRNSYMKPVNSGGFRGLVRTAGQPNRQPARRAPSIPPAYRNDPRLRLAAQRGMMRAIIDKQQQKLVEEENKAKQKHQQELEKLKQLQADRAFQLQQKKFIWNQQKFGLQQQETVRKQAEATRRKTQKQVDSDAVAEIKAYDPTGIYSTQLQTYIDRLRQNADLTPAEQNKAIRAKIKKLLPQARAAYEAEQARKRQDYHDTHLSEAEQIAQLRAGLLYKFKQAHIEDAVVSPDTVVGKNPDGTPKYWHDIVGTKEGTDYLQKRKALADATYQTRKQMLDEVIPPPPEPANAPQAPASTQPATLPQATIPPAPTNAQPAVQPAPAPAPASGRQKGPGYFGRLPRPGGGYSTEISIGVNFDGQTREIPSLVPTLTPEEIKYMLDGNSPTRAIVEKAVNYARQRISEGKSPFAREGEQVPVPGAQRAAQSAPTAQLAQSPAPASQPDPLQDPRVQAIIEAARKGDAEAQAFLTRKGWTWQ